MKKKRKNMFGICTHCGMKSLLVTRDKRCAPCRYKDSPLTKKHFFSQKENPMQEVLCTLDEVEKKIREEYGKECYDEKAIKDLYVMKRKIIAQQSIVIYIR